MRPGRDQWGADAFFEFMLRVSDPRLRRKLWHALLADPKATIWRFALTDLVLNGRTWNLAQYNAWMSDRFPPHTLVSWLEASVSRGFITRREANSVQECILARTDATGQWRATLYKPNMSGMSAGTKIPVSLLEVLNG